jgi:hypothetical protein
MMNERASLKWAVRKWAEGIPSADYHARSRGVWERRGIDTRPGRDDAKAVCGEMEKLLAYIQQHDVGAGLSLLKYLRLEARRQPPERDEDGSPVQTPVSPLAWRSNNKYRAYYAALAEYLADLPRDETGVQALAWLIRLWKSDGRHVQLLRQMLRD